MRLLLILFISYLAYQFIKALFAGKEETPVPKRTAQRPPNGGEDLVEDPYCHTYVPISDACKVIVEGKTVHFCSRKCQEAFIALREQNPKP